MNKNIIEAQNLPLEEKVYLKKDLFGWRVVEPPTKWYHYILGSKRNMFILIIILVIIFMMYLGMNDLLSSYKLIADNPCSFCNSTINSIKITP